MPPVVLAFRAVMPRGKQVAERYLAFAREYVVDMNGTRAAIAAGYSPKSAASIASSLLNVPKVQEYIRMLLAERGAKLDLNAERVLSELVKIGFSNIADYITIDGSQARIDLSKVTREKAAVIQELTTDTLGENRAEATAEGDAPLTTTVRTKLKLADKLRALDLLGRYLKLYTDKVQVDNDKALEVVIREVGA